MTDTPLKAWSSSMTQDDFVSTVKKTSARVASPAYSTRPRSVRNVRWDLLSYWFPNDIADKLTNYWMFWDKFDDTLLTDLYKLLSNNG